MGRGFFWFVFFGRAKKMNVNRAKCPAGYRHGLMQCYMKTSFFLLSIFERPKIDEKGRPNACL